jgi:DMSO/TMAO reductase YedYZ molybdopterin-dependent catalytic subunit
MNRRSFLQAAAALAASSTLGPRFARADDATPAAPASAGDPTTFPNVKFADKAEMRLLTDRPPQLEMLPSGLLKDVTPNDEFFVRWHLAAIPTSVDPKSFKLTVGGHVESPLSFSIDQLKKDFEPVSYYAVNQCSGNSRSFFSPRVYGGQWGNGAMGNAKWTGLRLKDLLAKAKVKSGAVDVTFMGLDRAPIPTIQPFEKSLTVEKAGDPDVIVAYAMNDADLPMLNGYPLRLIVPGWYGTYWVKCLNEIKVTNKPFEGFWMAKAYRIPKNSPDMQESPDNLAKETVPISTMTLRSLFASPEPNARLKMPASGSAIEVQGLALDSGKGITKVDVSVDDGKTWAEARLDKDLGKYAWRRFRFAWQPPKPGQYTLKCRASNAAGEQQTTQQWNRSGYGRNVIESLEVTVA